MSDKLALKLEITFFYDCNDNEIDKLKDKLEDLGWWILQESRIDKEIKSFPSAIETGYDVIVERLDGHESDKVL
jgi:methyl coenzyme M reductase subunit C-like uncharacterized protein (methanogenesis marker protein 7)